MSNNTAAILGAFCRKISTPSPPCLATKTEYPAFSSIIPANFVSAGSSSTTRMVPAPCGLITDGGSTSFKALGRHPRKRHCESCTLPWNAVHIHLSLVTTNDARHGSQAQSPAREFRSEERVKHPRLGGLIHARSGIFHLHENVRSSLRNSSRYPHCSPLRCDGFSAIDDQVHHHLADLTGISLDPGQSRREQKIQLDVLWNTGGNQWQHLRYQ